MRPGLWWRLVDLDARSVRRDALLAWIPLAPLAYAVALRLGSGPLRDVLQRHTDIDPGAVEVLLMSFLIVLGPSMAGLIVGFMFLDERDEGVLRALLVSPVTAAGFLIYRLALPVVSGVVLTLAAYPLAGLVSLPVGSIVAVTMLGAVTAPLMALALAGFARDKVEGFVVVKAVNVINLLPIAAFFLPEWSRVAVAWIPTYLPLAVYWDLAVGGSSPGMWLVALVAYVVWLAWLLRRWTRIASAA